MLAPHLDHRIYVWATSVPEARKAAIAVLRSQGHSAPWPEMAAHFTGLTRPGGVDIEIRSGYGEYKEIDAPSQRRYAVDVIV